MKFHHFDNVIITKFYRKIFVSILIPDFPIAIIILPQLESDPAIAVLKRGELAIENTIFFAFVDVSVPETLIDINF